jgi:putative phosphoesterase
MKRILVVSDLHGMRHKLERVLELAGDVNYIISLGDQGISPIAFHHPFVTMVKGNLPGDYGDKYEEVLEIDGHLVFITHGHRYFVHDTVEILVKRAKQLNCDIALFGHTHMVYAKNIDGILTLNPGSAFSPRNQIPPSYLLLTINDSEVIYSFRDAETGVEIQI